MLNSSYVTASTVGVASIIKLMVSLAGFVNRTTDRALLPVLGIILVRYGVIVRLNGSGKSASTVGIAGVLELVVSLAGFVNRTADRALLPMLGIILVGYCVIVRFNCSCVSASTVGVAGVVELVVSLSAFIDRAADRALLPVLGIVLVRYTVIVRLNGSGKSASTVGIARVVELVVSLSAFIDRAADRALLPMLGVVLIGCCVIVGCYGSGKSARTVGVARVVKLVVSLGGFVNRATDRALLPMLGVVIIGNAVIVGLNCSGKSASTVGVASVVELVVSLAGFVNRAADRALLPMLGIVFVRYAVIVGFYGSDLSAIVTIGVTSVSINVLTYGTCCAALVTISITCVCINV